MTEGPSDNPRRRGGLVAGAVALTAAIAVAVGARPIRRVEVAGASMSPALLPGDRLLVVRSLGVRWSRRRPLAPGDVVAVRDPRLPSRLLVKRVADLDHDAGTVWVLGDAPGASTDSRTFGAVPAQAVMGRAVYRYAPAGRTGRGPWAPDVTGSRGVEDGARHG